MPVDVVGVGIACSDVNITVTSIPKIDENVLVLDYRKHLGGTVSTALAALQRLGMRTKYMGMLGDDEYGRFTLEGMKAEGIDMTSVRLIEDERSPFSFVMVDSLTGRRSIAFYPGCAFTVPADVIDSAAIQSARLLHVDIANPAVFAACEIAKKAGVPVSLDANALYPGLEELLHMTNIFITAREITCGLSATEDPVEAGRYLLNEYKLDLAVVTLGAEGSVAVTHSEVAHAKGFPVEVVDTTGAGDVFHGAYLYGHISGWPIKRTLQFANAAGAIMCATQTGWTGIPTREEVEKFLKIH
ncbi:MAG: carbohydrate kinase family protein [Candidatus Abyssobacteria bacterium SURF_5]|uniref:Carbohydrate kinase family protein n=1 Tax=Abyssobacteria bacterium (strain SURF_5) TaxID=2093360 RepID=A0A3A4P1V9_ABYX5|nr:MAG: carbohydrate kinase family protein [Candidatus Abyssubacteria bacterium SURF_5]